MSKTFQMREAFSNVIKLKLKFKKEKKRKQKTENREDVKYLCKTNSLFFAFEWLKTIFYKKTERKGDKRTDKQKELQMINPSRKRMLQRIFSKL